MRLVLIWCLGWACTAQPSAQTASISGQLQDVTEAPLSRVEVRLKNSADGNVATAVSALEGEFEFDSLSAGTYEMNVTVPGFVRLQIIGLSLAPGDQLNLGSVTLYVAGFCGLFYSPVGPISFMKDDVPYSFGGRVMHRGRPVSGASVELRSKTKRSVTTSSRKGAFLFSGMPRGDYDLVVKKPGFVTAEEHFIPLVSALRERDYEIALERCQDRACKPPIGRCE